MAFKNKIITNKKTGLELKFLQTAQDTKGKLLEMMSTYPAHSTMPSLHYHPRQEEWFTVVSGELIIQLGRETIILREGDSIKIPKKMLHSMWNGSEYPTVVNWKVLPALETEFFFETIHGLANDNQSNKNGIPNFFHAVRLALKYKDVFRLASPPWIIQQIFLAIIFPLALIFGSKEDYSKYID